MGDLIIFAITLGATYLIGTTLIEKKHYRSIKERERKLLMLPAVTAKNVLETNKKIIDSHLVTGNVVISIDFFKKFLAGLRNIFGGEVHSYETILDRARREAILRMKEAAFGANIIINMRIETSNIGRSNRNNSLSCSEVLAWGTAVTYKGPEIKPPKELQIQEESKITKTSNKQAGLLEYVALAIGIIILIFFISLIRKG